MFKYVVFKYAANCFAALFLFIKSTISAKMLYLQNVMFIKNVMIANAMNEKNAMPCYEWDKSMLSYSDIIKYVH